MTKLFTKAFFFPLITWIGRLMRTFINTYKYRQTSIQMFQRCYRTIRLRLNENQHKMQRLFFFKIHTHFAFVLWLQYFVGSFFLRRSANNFDRIAKKKSINEYPNSHTQTHNNSASVRNFLLFFFFWFLCVFVLWFVSLR